MTQIVSDLTWACLYLSSGYFHKFLAPTRKDLVTIQLAVPAKIWMAKRKKNSQETALKGNKDKTKSTEGEVPRKDKHIEN